MTGQLPLVSVIIPARDEERAIGQCLDAVLAQTWPLERLEVVVIDGDSVDRTSEVAAARLSRSGVARWEVVVNPAATTPSNLNRGLEWARGDFVCRVDARSFVPPDYVGRCVALLSERADVAVVGGAQLPDGSTATTTVARAIARALRNPYVTGFARYRRNTGAGPADTVYLGAFRTADLRSVSGWDERFLTNQDYELNQRMQRRGLVWFEPALVVRYAPRESLRALIRQYWRFGRWKAAAWLEGDVAVARRQQVLLVAPVAGALAGVAVMRRAPAAVAVVAVAMLVLLDRTTPGEAPVRERTVAAVAGVAAAASWWLGVVTQAVAYARGDRIIGRADAQVAEATTR